MCEADPSCTEQFYVIHYVWKRNGTKKFAAMFASPSDAVNYMRTHIDDNVNIEWTISKVSKFDLDKYLKDL